MQINGHPYTYTHRVSRIPGRYFFPYRARASAKIEKKLRGLSVKHNGARGPLISLDSCAGRVTHSRLLICIRHTQLSFRSARSCIPHVRVTTQDKHPSSFLKHIHAPVLSLSPPIYATRRAILYTFGSFFSSEKQAARVRISPPPCPLVFYVSPERANPCLQRVASFLSLPYFRVHP